MNAATAQVHAELREVARDMLGAGAEWSQLARAGWLGLEVAERLGGSGATFAEVAVILQEMGRARAAGPYLGTAALGVGALNLLAADAVDDLLERVASGDLRLAVALPSGDATDVPFRLERHGGRLELSGRVEFVADAVSAERLLVVALDASGEPVVVVADPDQPGLVVNERPLVDATRQFAAVTADASPVNPDAVWHFRGDGRGGIGLLLDRGALAIACDCLGVAEAMLDATVAYAGMRRQFGRPIGSFQAVKHACADMLVQITIGRELLALAVEATASEDPQAWVDVSRAKSFLGTLAVDVAGKAMQLHGGFGYTWDSGVHAYLKRAVLDRALFGSPTAHRTRLAVRYGVG